jgi:hypothetical protein
MIIDYSIMNYKFKIYFTCIFIALAFFLANAINAQNDRFGKVYYDELRMGLNIGFVTPRYADLGVTMNYVDNPGFPKFIASVFLGTEYGRYGSQSISAAKLGLAYYQNFIVLGPLFKLTLLSYFSDQNNDLRIRPEIGLGFFGHFFIGYGVNFPLAVSRINEIQFGVFTISYTLNLAKWKSPDK